MNLKNEQGSISEIFEEVRTFETEAFDPSQVEDKKIPEIILLVTGLLLIIAAVFALIKCCRRAPQEPENDAEQQNSPTEDEKAPLNE